MPEIQNIPVREIVPGNNDRTVFDRVALEELADSIREHGLIQPISVRYLADPDVYQIIAGERRYRACQILQWAAIPCIVHNDISDEEAAALMLSENVARQDLDPVDEAHAYARRMEEFGWSIALCAEKAGVSRGRVEGRLKLLCLAEDVQRLVRHSQFPLGHAATMYQLDANRQRWAVRKYNENPMSKWEFRTLVASLYTAQVQEEAEGLFALEMYVVDGSECGVTRADPVSYVPVGKAPRCKPGKRGEIAQCAMERYILELLDAGFDIAAHAVGEVLRMTILSKGYAHLQPSESPILQALAARKGVSLGRAGAASAS